MSVINRMLLELEERPQGAAQAQLPGAVRAVQPGLPTAHKIPRWSLLLLISALLLGAAFVIWQKSAPVTPSPAVAQVEETFRIAPPAAISPTHEDQSTTPVSFKTGNVSPPDLVPEPAIEAATQTRHEAPTAKSKATKNRHAASTAKSDQYLLPARNDPAPQNP